jgi:hypothetical protein
MARAPASAGGEVAGSDVWWPSEPTSAEPTATRMDPGYRLDPSRSSGCNVNS